MAHDSSEQVLRLLRRQPDQYLSGEELSTALGVTRSAVWKQIRALRQAGYEIEAVTSRGYRLKRAPDRLLAAEIGAGLATGLIGREIVALEEIDSTNIRAWQLGEAGALAGTVVVADAQSSGKGRLGRSWTSPPGVNLYLSVLLRPLLEPRHAPQLTFLSSLAVATAIERCSGLQPQVKWPNDVLLNGRKVAGLLNEMSAETESIHFVILGIGVNLNMGADQFPPGLRYPATSLALELGRPVSRTTFCRILLEELDRFYSLYERRGFAPIREAWQGYFHLLGQRVAVENQHLRQVGTVAGLDQDGALLLQTDDGTTERILAGDVRPI